MRIDRLLAWLGSLIGNSTLFAAVAMGWPQAQGNFLAVGPFEGPTVISLPPFKPYILDHGYATPDGQVPACPEPRAEWGYGLSEAPLPVSFDRYARVGTKMYACVLVDRDGQVREVVLPGISDAGVAIALSSLIRRQWRFFPVGAGQGATSWIRVRLNRDPPERRSNFSVAVD